MSTEDTFIYFCVNRGLANIFLYVIKESEPMLFIVHNAV